MAYLCRCSNEKCKMRRALRRLPQQYILPPRCPGCGGRAWRWDRWQEQHNHDVRCRCAGYWFTHRRGSKWCEAATSLLSIQNLAQHYGGEPLDYAFHPRAGIIVKGCPF